MYVQYNQCDIAYIDRMIYESFICKAGTEFSGRNHIKNDISALKVVKCSSSRKALLFISGFRDDDFLDFRNLKRQFSDLLITTLMRFS